MQVLELQHHDYDETICGTTAESVFRNINKNTAAFIIWRIDENQRAVNIPKEQYGTFYKNEAYIVYAAFQKGQTVGSDSATKEVRCGILEHHIHFWLGSKITSNNSGVAAYKILVIDEQLGQIATQHREAQGNESSRFKSYFKSGIRILNNIKKEEDKPDVALYKVTGKQISIITQEDEVSWKYFSSNCVFVIVAPTTVFVWIGQAASGVEKLHATKTALSFKTDLNISKIIFVDDGYEKTLNETDKKELTKFLPLENRIVIPQESLKTHNYERGRHTLRLYHCSDNYGKYRITEIKSGPILQTDLTSKDVYILDNGFNGVWIWVGKGAEEAEKTNAIRNARGFVKKKNYPYNTTVTRVVENHEPLEFKMLFLTWKDNGEAPKKGRVPLVKFDAMLMFERPTLAADLQLVDDGSGLLNVWKVTSSGMVEVPKDCHGSFFSGDCYLISYIYNDIVTRSFIYYWLGAQALHEDIEAAKMSGRQMNGNSTVIRVIQDYEPQHFLQLFRGKMIIYRAKFCDSEIDAGYNFKKQSHYLLQVTGSTTYSSKAVQVQCKAASLNSNYCYVLKKHRLCYIWCGSYSTGDQREIAKGFASKDFDMLMEGKEPSKFWDDVGGGKPEISTKIIEVSGNLRPPRLFIYCTNSTSYKYEEICNFTQNELVPEDIILLDASHTVFVWLGDLSSKEDRKLSLEIASTYLKIDPVGRNLNIPVVEVCQGYEPPIFTGFFPTWSNEYFSTYKSFEEVRNELEGRNHSATFKDKITSNDNDKFQQHVKYPISILISPSDKLPIKVDPLKRELHLTHDDFVTLFNMDYGVFENLPKWKQSELKKKVGLF